MRPQERRPGRSFERDDEALGENLIRHSPEDSVPNRAKAVAVLRKAEEFMHHANPPPVGEKSIRRALELAAGRTGLTLADYDRIVKDDPELQELERKVLAFNAI